MASYGTFRADFRRSVGLREAAEASIVDRPAAPAVTARLVGIDITHIAGNRRARLVPCGPWGGGTGAYEVTYIITENCVDLLDKTCIGECPVDCIYEGDRMVYIHPDECVDCGACEP